MYLGALKSVTKMMGKSSFYRLGRGLEIGRVNYVTKLREGFLCVASGLQDYVCSPLDTPLSIALGIKWSSPRVFAVQDV